MSEWPLLPAGLFALACALLLLLPFLPAWLEWRWPTDSAPLPVPREDGDDPLARAERVRTRVARLRLAGPGVGYEPVREVDLLDPEAPAALGGLPVLACRDVRAVGGFELQRLFYAMGDVDFHSLTSFHEVMAEGSLTLGAGSRIRRWGHADRTLRLGERSLAAGQLGSGQAIRLERGCCFQRLHAPDLRFGPEPGPAAPAPDGTAPQPMHALPGAVQRAPGHWRVEGNCSVPAGSAFAGSLVVTGVLTLGPGSRVEGSVKAHRGIVVGEAATVTGAAICPQAIHVLRDARVGGPLVSESHLLVRSGARLGLADAPTTVSAAGIVAEEGAVAHGCVRAQDAGVVVGRGV